MPKRFTEYLIGHNAFRDDPMIAIDAGVAGGFESMWEIYGDQAHLYGFDPNEVESHKKYRHTYRVALGNRKGAFPFYIAQHDHSSSFFLPAPERCGVFPWESTMATKETRTETIITLDDFASKNSIRVDYIKLDVEGAELEVLYGARRQLEASVLGISTEVLFRPVRHDAPPFHKIDAYLDDLYFSLYHLKGYRHFRRTLSVCPYPENRGQMVWAQVLYFRDAAIDVVRYPDRWPPARVAKMASLLDLTGFPDCAIEVVQAAQDQDIIEPRTAETWVDLLTPQVDGQDVTYKEYWDKLRMCVPMDKTGKDLAYLYKRHWSPRI